MSEDKPPRPRIVEMKPKDVLWPNPVDAITEFARDAAEGKIKPSKVFILWFEESDERLRPHRWCANVTQSEAIALLEVGKLLEIEDWRS